jgi:Papain family cysteine protease
MPTHPSTSIARPLTRRRFINSAATLAGTTAAAGLTWTPAQATDLRQSNLITPVKDQDDPVACNSCTAYAVVATVEGTYNKKHPGLGPMGPDLDEMDLFTRATPAPKGGCATDHWWPKYALTYCQNRGLAWEGNANKQRINATPKNLLLVGDLNKTQKAMKDHIDNTGPVIAVMLQYEDFYLFGDYWSQENPQMPNPSVYSPGITASGKKRHPGQIVGGHVVSIVGYNGNNNWICKNSWGKDWNGDGYVLIAQGKGGNAECYIDLIDVWGVVVA